MALFWRRKKPADLLEGEIQAASTQSGGAFEVRLNGRITIDSSPSLRLLFLEKLDDRTCDSLNADCRGVSYMDTSGLAIFVETLKAAKVRGKVFRLSGLRERPRFLLERTRLLHLFTDQQEDEVTQLQEQP